MPFLSPNQQCQSTEGKNITFHGLVYPKLTWGLPTLSLTTNSCWLPCGRFAMPLISPLNSTQHLSQMLLSSSSAVIISIISKHYSDCTDYVAISGFRHLICQCGSRATGSASWVPFVAKLFAICRSYERWCWMYDCRRLCYDYCNCKWTIIIVFFFFFKTSEYNRRTKVW